MVATLVIVDIQNDYFPGYAFPLVGADDAAARAGELLAGWRDRGAPVVHVRHVWEGPDAAFMRPDTAGSEIHPLVAPRGEETVIIKEHPNAFRDTPLDGILTQLDTRKLVVCGMMSSLCVDATVRAAADLGYSVTVAHDACAAPDLTFEGETVPGRQVHAAFMAALADSYATMTPVRELVA
ncbi:cysteine hydrolase family protein [Microbacterium aurantiacum]|uniref:cysteine hydrolase family protein n=1 Tax=Microbacterium aurantiacum TaxID=162393 RepID=UPI003F499875